MDTVRRLEEREKLISAAYHTLQLIRLELIGESRPTQHGVEEGTRYPALHRDAKPEDRGRCI